MAKKDHSIDYEQLVDNISAGIMLIDEKLSIKYVNPAGLRILNLSDKPVDDLSHYFHLDSFNQLKKNIQYVIANQQSIHHSYKLYQNSKEPNEVEIQITPYFSQHGQNVCLFINEITHSTHIDKIQSIRELSASIVHEVRNPLTAVKGFIQLLKEGNDPKYLQTMEKELNKALITLNQLLQVTKPEIQDEPIASINLCQELDSIAYLFQEKLFHIKINKAYRHKDASIIGRRNSIVKALFNLFKNAIESIEEHGEIKIEHYADAHMIHVKISDNGVGMTSENVTMLGTPFYSTKEDGTGVGLTQVFTTIHNHNGQIYISSELGKGTTFHLCLPKDTSEEGKSS